MTIIPLLKSAWDGDLVHEYSPEYRSPNTPHILIPTSLPNPGGFPMNWMTFLPMTEILATHQYPNAPVYQDSHPGGLRPDRALYKVASRNYRLR